MVLSIWFLSLEEAISDICMCGPKKTFHLIPRVGESSVKLKCWRAPSALHAAEAGGPSHCFSWVGVSVWRALPAVPSNTKCAHQTGSIRIARSVVENVEVQVHSIPSGLETVF